MSLVRVADGELATIVTSLQMVDCPRPRPLPPSPLRLDRWRDPGADRYRALFLRIGGPWLWFSRLVIDDAMLKTIIHHPSVELYVATGRSGIELGMLELDFREDRMCELAYVGLVPELTAQGNGRWLMANALQLAWRREVERVWVHTCSLDHPRALGFYIAAGFTPFARAVESFPDPRLLGILPRELAPHVPLIDPASRR